MDGKVIERQIGNSQWDIICFMETHKRRGQEYTGTLKGFKKLSNNRNVWNKRGDNSFNKGRVDYCRGGDIGRSRRAGHQ